MAHSLHDKLKFLDELKFCFQLMFIVQLIIPEVGGIYITCICLCSAIACWIVLSVIRQQDQKSGHV